MKNHRRIISLGLLLFLFIGCNKKYENQKPTLNVTSSIEGLTISLEGSASDIDGTIKQVIIDWGNGKNESLYNIDFANFTASHTYSNPDVFNIKITAFDNEGGDVSQIISAQSSIQGTILENIKPDLFKTNDKEYLILTINLHTYQESQQDDKFNLLVDAIGGMDIDFIAFQECAQHKSSPIVSGNIRDDNMALIIKQKLKLKYNVDYNFVWDWAHYGWNVWEEGVAVLSKYPLLDSDEKFISSNTSTGSITSRKVIYGSYQLDDSKINIFSAHTHWRTTETDEEQNNQIKNIQQMATEKEDLTSDVFTFVCGDFNGNPTSDFPWSEGYNTMMANNDYQDSFFEIHPDANNKPDQSIYHTVGGTFPGRIDYIFMKENPRYEVKESQIIFTNNVVGVVSDHFGVLTKIMDTE